MPQTHEFHTLILGTGAAGLAAAKYLLEAGIKNIALVSEGLKFGTSINTGSDKQTYYKMSLYSADSDSPEELAKTLFDGGSMHGDLALVEAANSVRAFSALVELGVPFPQDEYGQFIGYKTDHDPLRRATSCGPYTSQEMCRVLIEYVNKNNIPVFEDRVAVELLTIGENTNKRACGIITIDGKDEVEVFLAQNIVFAVGGPGGLYLNSVYPAIHTGAIGLALQAGALAQGLPESQYGLASIKFRWNVSGTYMQVLPRFISTAADGVSDEQEFLLDAFDGKASEMNSMIFLKGYQWPFDARKVNGGSSVIDLLVYRETMEKGRRVYLDFRTDALNWSFDELKAEAKEYLMRSGACVKTPIKRLEIMNPAAIALYKRYGIDLTSERLEISVCAQHNNGGLATDKFYESLNIKHLFPIGEVNGSHGVYRPGGSALNAGQVGAIRCATAIAHRHAEPSLDLSQARHAAIAAVDAIEKLSAKTPTKNYKTSRTEFQKRMSACGAHIRKSSALPLTIKAAWEQYSELSNAGIGREKRREYLRNLQLCYAHAVYLEAIKFQIDSNVGSRGSVLVTEKLEEQSKIWRFNPENPEFRNQVLTCECPAPGKFGAAWSPCRPLPHTDDWFEKVWARFRESEIYK